MIQKVTTKERNKENSLVRLGSLAIDTYFVYNNDLCFGYEVLGGLVYCVNLSTCTTVHLSVNYMVEAVDNIEISYTKTFK